MDGNTTFDTAQTPNAKRGEEKEDDDDEIDEMNRWEIEKKRGDNRGKNRRCICSYQRASSHHPPRPRSHRRMLTCDHHDETKR